MAKKKTEEGNKVLINSGVLNKALKEISAAVVTTAVLPILYSVHCAAKKKSIVLTTTDMGITMIKEVECECSGEFIFLMPFKVVYDYTSKIPNQAIEILVDGDIFIKDDGGKTTFGKSESPEHFPVRKDVEEKYRTNVDEKFLKALQKSKECVSRLENDVVFTNVLVDINEEQAMIISSDKLRMFRYKQKSSGGKLKALLTPHFIKAIAGMKEAELYGNDEWIVAKSGSLEVVDRTAVVTNYPDCSFFFDNYKYNCKLAASDLISKLDEILAFPNSFYVCELVFKKDAIVVKYDDNDINYHYEKEIKAKHSVEVERIGFNVRDLKGLLLMIEQDELSIYIKDSTQGAHFDNEYNDTNTFLMPLAIIN